MLDWLDIIARLGSAALIGGIIGLNRDLHKSSGLRTFSLVGLGAALVVLLTTDGAMDPNATSRVLQGIITGVGFLGAGVIVHEAATAKVRGLTTAAAIWIAGCSTATHSRQLEIPSHNQRCQQRRADVREGEGPCPLQLLRGDRGQDRWPGVPHHE